MASANLTPTEIVAWIHRMRMDQSPVQIGRKEYLALEEWLGRQNRVITRDAEGRLTIMDHPVGWGRGFGRSIWQRIGAGEMTYRTRPGGGR